MYYSDSHIGLDDETRRLIAENRGDAVDVEMHNNAGGGVGLKAEDRDEDYEDLPEELQGPVGFLYTLRDIVGSK